MFTHTVNAAALRIGAAVLAALLPTAAAAAANPSVVGSGATPLVATSASGVVTAVWIDSTPKGAVALSKSRRRGATWGRVQPILSAPSITIGSIAGGRSGETAVTAVATDSAGAGSLVALTRSSDGVWSPPLRLDRSAGPRAVVAISSTGDTTVAWCGPTATSCAPRIAIKRRGQATFGPAQAVDGDAPAAPTDIVYAADGTALTTVLRRDGMIRVVEQDPSSASTVVASLTEPGSVWCAPGLAVGANATFAAWCDDQQLWIATRRGAGAWQVEPGPPAAAEPDQPAVAVLADGTYLIVVAAVVRPGNHRRVIAYTRSPGGVWSGPRHLAAGAVVRPRIGVGDSGTLVVWETRRAMIDDLAVEGAMLRPDGTWSPPRRIAGPDATTPAVAGQPSAPMVLAWAQGGAIRSLVMEDFSATFALPSVTGPALSGRTVRCSSGAGSVQWVRDGRVVRGATSRTYRVRPDDRGRALTCRVGGQSSAGIRVRAIA